MEFYSSWTGLCWWLVLLVLASFASIMLSVAVVVALPATYYQSRHRPTANSSEQHPGLRWLAWLGRNVLGSILIVLGVFLSLPGIPGQGILTILIGLLVLDLPGKRALERNLVGRPSVLRAINRLRNRFGKAPLILDSETL